ncbi:PQQ-binding-like beta-propeller repeat protein [Halomarina salina]|uniref:PQQ-binding-like beta-propeller repeat protein n=1 Tax=Halomarina salina TaxID=1872699 RepID=A0ABD5RPG8_9EURY|nr:PQQ-binding-like beta-propeller repeat protein [Halomarina salina]
MPSRTPSRRRFLALAGTTGVTALAGCLGFGGDDRPEYSRPSTEGPPPEPDRHVFASDGEWSSEGFDAANTRWDYGGSAPREEPSVRWRRGVGQSGLRAPTVSDGRVYVTETDRLMVVDATSGETEWELAGETPRGKPSVSDGTVYTVADDVLQALDAETGEQRWSRSFDGPLTMPATVQGEYLTVGERETVHVVSAEDGSVNWSRRLVGRVSYPALGAVGASPFVATGTGGVYSLGAGGEVGVHEDLSARFSTPPTLGRDFAYVGDDSGTLYALEPLTGAVEWSADQAAGRHGIAYTDNYVYSVNGSTLRAFDTESGEEYWSFDVGDGTGSPAAVGDTVYVGGDALYALDPADGGGTVRFKMDLGGHVTPDISAGDGVLYVPVVLENGAEVVAVEPGPSESTASSPSE